MRENFEVISLSEQAPLRCIMRHIGNIDTHVHEYFEIDMVIAGRCQVKIGEEISSLQTDDVLSIDAHSPHSFSGTNCTIITIQFEQTHFERTLPDPRHPDFLCNSALHGNSPAYESMRRCIARMVKNNAEHRTGFELRNLAMVYEIMDIMYQNFRIEDSEVRNQRAHRYSARMAQISRIISESYSENLTLSDLADKVHLSGPYLSKFFEKQFGVNFLAYLTRVRLDHAVNELLKSNDNIETISANSGFPNSHAFVQAFKKEYGVLPSVYRRRENKIAVKETIYPLIEQHDYMAGLKKYLDTASPELQPQAISCRAAVRVNANVDRLRHTWRSMITATSANAILLADVQDMLRRVQREVGFKYIKFNGILSEQMQVYFEDADKSPYYRFLYVDKVFDFLLSIGLRPFVQLSFMPEALAKSNNKRLFGYLVSEPSSLSKWCALVTALVKHLQERYGGEEIRKWHFCVWDQPDTPESLYGFSSNEAFYQFYEGTYRAVKSCDENISFGSPASYYIIQKDYTNWYIPFLAWCKENNCVPDFLNFHYYDTAFTDLASGQEAFGFAYAMTLRDTANGFNSFVLQCRNERKRHLSENVPIYLTEWNNTPSQQDFLNDTCFKSCYIVKGILENYDKLDSFAYWSLTDWMGETPQPRELFSGGLGLFTVNAIPKAGYHVFPLLKQLGDTLLGRGEGWFITKSQGEYQIILYNYRHFSHLYAMGERFDMTFTNRYTPFSPEQALDVHLSLSDIEDGEYVITETTVNRRSGSAFDTWVSMGAIEPESPAELENLANRSVPAISKYIAKAEKGILRLDALLDMLEVRLIVVRPK